MSQGRQPILRRRKSVRARRRKIRLPLSGFYSHRYKYFKQPSRHSTIAIRLLPDLNLHTPWVFISCFIRNAFHLFISSYILHMGGKMDINSCSATNNPISLCEASCQVYILAAIERSSHVYPISSTNFFPLIDLSSKFIISLSPDDLFQKKPPPFTEVPVVNIKA